MLVASRVTRRLRRLERSRSLQFCYTCGYDLCGNESGVCPECGSPTFAGELRRRAALAAAEAESVAHAVVDEEPEALDESDEALSVCGDEGERAAAPQVADIATTAAIAGQR